ncbi:T9SS type A sorting domain-containing protein [Flavobacterium branchiicola]|uniref:T9SS type A sorting domain-containing protein n=1 Tax=Flavobacterium branchiicola TaxID=1114875 RepID=A0ABV9PK53_9FLAO|nr:T9SS type A sorting domain-containing protein [Flavobacterium branchiicola]MBS7256358.1 SEL1-like repeat protein [Flavobacterium branchiicola]
MKKITKKAVLLLLILGGMVSYGQNTPEIKKELRTASLYLLQGTNVYNPKAAIDIYLKLAEKGNVESMNSLGLIYNKGIGGTKNEELGKEWLERAANAGYSKARYNLGVISQTSNPAEAIKHFEIAAKAGYKRSYSKWGGMAMKGEGTAQDYSLALTIFKEGSEKGDVSSTYSLGYMYYKGLGCQQNYSLAVQQFEIGAKKGNLSAMYMLGLCYRNGYGVTIDTEKAKYWLLKASERRHKKSQIELDDPEAENAVPNQRLTLSKTLPEVTSITEINAPETFLKVKQAPISKNISGNYTGQLIRYDWSGQNIISQTPLQIDLKQDDSKLSGVWNEEHGDSAPFTAQIMENAIVFEDSKIDRTEHFYKDTIATYSFKEAKIQLIDADESLFIVGNLQLYNIKEKENERPMYIILDKKQEKNIQEKELISSVIAYPNPVLNDFNLSFNLAHSADVEMSIHYINGVQIYKQQWKNLPAGQQTKTLVLNAPTGYYLLRLTYESEVKTTILIKR